MRTSAHVIALACTLVIVTFVTTGAQSTPARISANQLAAESVYQELKERGLDPLSAASPSEIRSAFIDYHAALGDSLTLLGSPGAVSSAEELSAKLSATALRSQVRIRTTMAGARVLFRLIGRSATQRMPQLTNDAFEDMPIGLYQIWSERNGIATSSTSDVFRIIRRQVEVDLVEQPSGQR
jgi:hypothetical protein